MAKRSNLSIYSSRKHLLVGLGLMIVLAALYVPVTWLDINEHQHNDYYLPLGFAENMQSGEEIPEYTRGHPVWQIAVLAIRKLPLISLKTSALILQLAGALLVGVILYELLLRTGNSPFFSAGLVLVTVLVAPMFLLVFEDDLFYLGYIGINTYHNPTINWLKPLAIFLFIYAVQLTEESAHIHWVNVLVAAMVTILSTLLKPNFTICLFPALGLVTLYQIINKKTIHWSQLILGMVLPGVLVLSWQFFVTYTSGEAGMAFAPLAVMRYYSDHLLMKLILSIWFPLLVSVLFYKDTRRDTGMILGWLVFFIGAGYTYLLAETGNRFAHGNFGWSGEISNFILFSSAVIFFARQCQRGKIKTWKGYTALVVGLLPHFIFGVIYYVVSLFQDRFV